MSFLNSQDNAPLTITTLNELVTALSEGERTTYNGIVRSMNIPKSVFNDHCSWSDDCYTRNCIIDTEEFELILLCWGAGHATPIHDHGGEECWVSFIEGEFKETIYQLDEKEELQEVKSEISTSNDISYMIDFMGFHSIENLSNTRSMSLHLYAKPIRSCNAYCEEAGEIINKDLSYTTISEFENI